MATSGTTLPVCANFTRFPIDAAIFGGAMKMTNTRRTSKTIPATPPRSTSRTDKKQGIGALLDELQKLTISIVLIYFNVRHCDQYGSDLACRRRAVLMSSLRSCDADWKEGLEPAGSPGIFIVIGKREICIDGPPKEGGEQNPNGGTTRCHTEGRKRQKVPFPRLCFFGVRLARVESFELGDAGLRGFSCWRERWVLLTERPSNRQKKQPGHQSFGRPPRRAQVIL